MTEPDAFLLSPYRPPTSYPVTLTREEAGAWLAAYFALWHPALVAELGRPPSAASGYDHDQPLTNAVYALVEGPPLYLPEDWASRIETAGAASFTAAPEAAETARRLRDAVQSRGPLAPVWGCDPEWPRLFAGVGYGVLMVQTLFDAQAHDPILDAERFWHAVRAAARTLRDGGPDADVRAQLVDAAGQLQQARETLNPTAPTFIDWVWLTPETLGDPWPATLAHGWPLTVAASADLLERQAAEFPERFAELKARFAPDAAGTIDLACGSYVERDDAYLPPESQWWNLTEARAVAGALLGRAPELYARKRTSAHPQLPSWLTHTGFRKAVLVSFDGAALPGKNAAVLNWPSPDGQTVDAFGREPQDAGDPQTFFNLAHTLHQAGTNDSAPVVALAHSGPAAVGYAELLALADLAPALGEFSTVSGYLGAHQYGEYLGTTTADDFVIDALDDRVTVRKLPDPVSAFARHVRLRRRVDSAYALAALHRTLPTLEGLALDPAKLADLAAVERQVELTLTPGTSDPDEPLAQLEAHFAQALANRLQARSAASTPGVLVFNPCGFTRRVALELPDFGGPIPVADPVKAAQFDGGVARLVVEVPGLGFAWLPRTAGGAQPRPRIKTAEGATVRNEFLEAEIDPATGGLRAVRDLRNRLNRLGMQPVFSPGGKSRCTGVAVTAAGAALGEVTAIGEILDEAGRVRATFRHRLRAWVGRPVLEVRLDIAPTEAPHGYPWHSYLGARFGWRDERATLFRGVNGANTQTSAPRPVSGDYLEVRLGSERTFVFTGGLPFLLRHGTRAADAVLIPEGEAATRFEFAVALDRDIPMQTAAGFTAPVPVVYTDRGPPNGMLSSSLAHLDLPSLLLTGLKPGAGRELFARFVETAGFGGTADLRFALPPTGAFTVDGDGEKLRDINCVESVVPLEFSAGEAFRVRVGWE